MRLRRLGCGSLRSTWPSLGILVNCSYNKHVYVWDEAKRKSNLEKHGLDFKDAYLVHENPDKCTYDASRDDEYRF